MSTTPTGAHRCAEPLHRPADGFTVDDVRAARSGRRALEAACGTARIPSRTLDAYLIRERVAGYCPACFPTDPRGAA